MVLLLTGAIDIHSFDVPFTSITSVDERLSQYLYSIEYAITRYRLITEIVFCENTGYAFDHVPLQEKALKNGKKLEILSFRGDYDQIKQKGKGYGEGEIIRYALQNSEILGRRDTFFKLTGRLVVKNMDEIITTTRLENSFIYHPKNIYQIPVDHVETFFYKVNKNLYTTYLMDAYKEVDEPQFRFLEHLFYERLSSLDLQSFKRVPLISGFSGSSGDPYESGKKAEILERINCFIGVHNLKKTVIEKLLTQLFSFVLKVRKLLKWT